MEPSGQSINRNALASLICGFLPPLILAVFVASGALQEIGYDIFIESYRYEDLARVVMLMLSAAAVMLGYRAKSQIAASNGFYRGAKLASVGRIMGFAWATLILFFLFLFRRHS